MMTNLCDCGNIATWLYMPSYSGEQHNDFYCDICVPRGCSCNTEPIDGNYDNLDPTNWEEPLDNLGRKWPCCEYSYIGELNENKM